MNSCTFAATFYGILNIKRNDKFSFHLLKSISPSSNLKLQNWLCYKSAYWLTLRPTLSFENLTTTRRNDYLERGCRIQSSVSRLVLVLDCLKAFLRWQSHIFIFFSQLESKLDALFRDVPTFSIIFLPFLSFFFLFCFFLLYICLKPLPHTHTHTIYTIYVYRIGYR